ncbi:hypothetical protein HN011_008637 [Eciton burchellii]|nr:hypothetical protein HN011_008637 [Eciton burchellii]
MHRRNNQWRCRNGERRCENEAFARTSRQIRPDDLADGICASKHYRTQPRKLSLSICGPISAILSWLNPDPSSQHPIHMLIGSNLFASILVHEPLRLGPTDAPAAQKTVFGWILSSPVSVVQSDPDKAHVSLCTAKCDTNILLRKFWEDKEVPQKLPLKEEDEQCENHFVSTHSRGVRYIVRLSFKAGPPIVIGDSLQIATALHTRMEGRLQSCPEISQQYHEFLREYLELGHMESITEGVTIPFQPVYIPHHAMIRESSSTTKLCVVFDASCQTRNGTSLNDHLLVGPKLQLDLPAIVARWR